MTMSKKNKKLISIAVLFLIIFLAQSALKINHLKIIKEQLNNDILTNKIEHLSFLNEYKEKELLLLRKQNEVLKDLVKVKKDLEDSFKKKIKSLESTIESREWELQN